ncbi:Vacuolar protein 8 [Mortierella sp. AM989]|nr:Vacuolar protein 8 [Mortierella sp. AM989]
MAKANPFEEKGSIDAVLALANSRHEYFQKAVFVAFAEVSREGVAKIDCKTLKPVIHLLMSDFVEVQEIALSTLHQLSRNNDNARLILLSGTMIPLISLMVSSDKKIHCLIARCIISLACQDQNKRIIASSGSLVPLLRLARSKDVKVQREATGALIVLALLEGNRQHLVDAGAVPAMLNLLKASDERLRINSIAILNRIGFDVPNLKLLATIKTELVDSVIAMSNSTDCTAKREAALAFRLFAKQMHFQDEIVRRGGLESLRQLLLSTDQATVAMSLICLSSISDRPQHQSRLIDGGFMGRLSELLSNNENETQRGATLTLLMISRRSELGKVAVLEAGVIQRVRNLILGAPPDIQVSMAALAYTLTESETLRPRLMKLGVLDIFICCTTSSDEEVCRYCMDALLWILLILSDRQPVVDVWKAPAGGIHDCLLRNLDGTDDISRNRALGVISYMLRDEHTNLRTLLKDSANIRLAIKRIAQLAGQPPWRMMNPISVGAFNVNIAKGIISFMDN